MKVRIAALSIVAALALSGSLALAEAAKEVTLKGDLTCGKCALKEASKCQDVLVVKEGDKEVHYNITFADKQAKHVCSGKKQVQVTGTVSEKEGKKSIAATKVEEVKA